MSARRGLYARRAVASLEFALLCPTLLAFVGGLTDFGLALADKSRLASAVALGARYAVLHPSTSVATIETLVSGSASLQGITFTGTTLAYHCITSGTSPALTAGTTTATSCTDGSTSGYYAVITASYAYAALMPLYSGLVNTTLTETVTVRIR